MNDALMHSTATPDEQDEFLEGACHHLALALNRHLGWHMELALDYGELYWEDPSGDPDNVIPAVLHVYAVSPDGLAWDILGARPWGVVRAEATERWSPRDLSFDTCRGAGELRPYVGCWSENEKEKEGGPAPEPIDRPLSEVEDGDIARAWSVAQRVFAHLPAFQSAIGCCAPRVKPH